MGHRAFQYLLKPTAQQTQRLESLLTVQRELYNAALEERRGAWRWEGRSVRRLDQYGQLTGMALIRPDLMQFGVCPARGTLRRLDRAFDLFFRRVRMGFTPGFPRFKGPTRFDSVEYPDDNCWGVDEAARRLHLRGVGAIKVHLHRPLRGDPKTCTVKREGRRWRLTVVCADVPSQRLPLTGRDVGLDRGVVSTIATSDGTIAENPRFIDRSAERLAEAQRSLRRHAPGSNRRRRAVDEISRIHRKTHNQRRDWLHNLSRSTVNDYDLIVIEDLRIANLTRRPRPRPDGQGGYEPNGAVLKSRLNRSILDAGWGILDHMLTYKAEDAGRELIRVVPRHTSQRCHSCGHTSSENRVTQAEFRCQSCGHRAHADVNAARNILRAGLALREAQAEREVA